MTDDTLEFRKMTADNHYHDVELMGDGMYVALHRLMYHWTMIIGACEDHWGYRDRYCFENYILAKAALGEWKNRDFQGEPLGWHRHPPSGRRRKDGDPNTEYIEF